MREILQVRFDEGTQETGGDVPRLRYSTAPHLLSGHRHGGLPIHLPLISSSLFGVVPWAETNS